MSSRRILPTKINLINLRRNIKLVTATKRLLENKREVLLLYLRNFALEYERYFNELNVKMKEIYGNYLDAVVDEGSSNIDMISNSVPHSLEINTSTRIIFGVKITSMNPVSGSIPQRYFGGIETSPKLSESCERLGEILPNLIRLAELESTIRLLVAELRKTQRLINAIDYSILPSYNTSLKYIRLVLEDRQREEFVRLKVVRRILERKRNE
ncbi:V-type ATP synthase subunit D [Sulfolobales archaeon HS-7]|nr:V-type ATP synthase subunit D [Sulfolobales archaeon HS-7]